MISALLIAIVLTFTYLMWRRYSEFNSRQLQICKHCLEHLLAKAGAAGETKETIEILLNAAIDTYNERLRGPWFYKSRWKIPAHEYKKEDDENKESTKLS
ncbi:hypothetical protein LCGC14_3167040 [marine sediment metagenome]|uniref:Uncharacterized protein n=1 Tax=marine sediment metagenome TaxID=412755 RepID=A0A0F8W8W2_9ZZZZ